MQSALTGESLPVTKGPGDSIYSGSTCKQGEIEAVVIATGVHTFFGKAAHLVDSTNQQGHFQKVKRCNETRTSFYFNFRYSSAFVLSMRCFFCLCVTGVDCHW